MSDDLSSAQKQTLQEAVTKPYKEQGSFFLNAFWNELGDKAEEVWKYWKKFLDLDRQQHNALPKEKKPETYVENVSLDEFWSHKMLESIGRTLTAIEFRTEFKKIDANFDKRMSFLEFLVWQYQMPMKEMLQRPQGSDGGEIIKAQNLLNEVAAAFTVAQEALDTSTKTAEQAKKAKEAAVASENAAKAAADSAKKKEEAANAAAAAAVADSEKAKTSAEETAKAAHEQQAAVDELKSQEDAHACKTKELEEKAQAGGVSGMRAKNELAQHLAEDPLPLRKAKLSATAAAKKLEKSKQVADEAAAAAEKSKLAAEKSAAAAREEHDKADHAAAAAEKDRVAAEESALAAEKDRLAAVAAVEDGQKKLEEAEAYLEEQKRKGSGERKGSFWWMDRELRERKEHMPRTGNAKLLF